MKVVLKLAALGVAIGVVGLFLLPFLVAGVIAGQLQQASQLAAQWDIPPEVVPALQDAGQRAAIPWFLLAGIASVATDFARHGPDGAARGEPAGTAIFPVVAPPIEGPGGGLGMFLIDGHGAELTDAQDVRLAADWLAGQLATLAQGDPLSLRPLGDADAGRFWDRLLAGAPLAIAAPAAGGGGTVGPPVDPGANPIRQYGSAVLTNIGAPITGANLDAFSAWAAGEGACARFNPLATTQPEPGAIPFNNLSGGGHVWNYPSFATGVQATTTALTNGLYQPVISAFQASAGVDAVAAAVEQSPWGTQTFGSPSYDAHQCGDAFADPGSQPPSLPTVTGPDAVAATIVARAVRYQSIWAQIVAPTPTATTISTTP